MLRKITAGILIIISSILLGLSIAGIRMIWVYRQPLTQTGTVQLQSLDKDLSLAQAALQNAKLELERTLCIIDSAEKSMLTLKAEFSQAKALFGDVNGTLDKQLIPGLKASRVQLEKAKSSLAELQVTLKKINALPLVNANFLGDQMLADLIANASSMDIQIAQAEDLVHKASTFLGDASYLMGSDFTGTKTSLQNFLVTAEEYNQKVVGWRSQLAWLLKYLPGWVETGAKVLIIFLLWFGISQVSMIQHGLSLWRGRKFQVQTEGQSVVPVKTVKR